MTDNHKQSSKLEICSRCKEISDLNRKKICYWCELEANTRGQDVYNLPDNLRCNLDEGDEL